MRITNFILSFMFLLFAAVQYNDPDPVLWILIYTAAATICLLAGFNKYYRPFIVVCLLVSFSWAVSLATSIFTVLTNHGTSPLLSFSMIKDKEIEEARESLGLFIVFGVLIWKYFESKKNKPF